MKQILSLKIPLIAPSLNKFYSGMHYQERSKLAKIWHQYIWALVRIEATLPVDKYPVAVVTQRFTKSKRLLDTSNSCMGNKFIEDGLVKAGILVNDTPQYVGFSAQNIPIGGCDKDETIVRVYSYVDFFKGL